MSEIILKNMFEELCAERAAEFEKLKFKRHFFSLRHRRVMKEIIYLCALPQTAGDYSSRRRIPLRNRIIIVLTIIFVAAIGITAGADAIGSFSSRFHSDHIDIEAIDCKDAPDTLERIYHITELPEGFKLFDQGTTVSFYFETYVDETNNKLISFQQIIKSAYHQTIEDDYLNFEEITINGKNAIYWESNAGGIVLWDKGDYFIHIIGNLPKDDLVKLAESIEIKK